MKIIEQTRKKQPLIHHLTNEVVMNFSANGLLSFGGSPIMAKEVEEAEDMANIADGLLINIGTILRPEFEAMIVAGKTANRRGIPVVLDPVGVAATSFRKQAVQTLLDEIKFSAIKGNAGEMAHLVNIDWKTKGVDSVDGDVKMLERIAIEVANKYDTVAIVTGEIDVVAFENEVKVNKSGHHFLPKVTGAGCLLGSIVTACLTTDANKFDAAFEAVHFYGKAAEMAVKQNDVNGPGTFLPHFIDALGMSFDAE